MANRVSKSWSHETYCLQQFFFLQGAPLSQVDVVFYRELDVWLCSEPCIWIKNVQLNFYTLFWLFEGATRFLALAIPALSWNVITCDCWGILRSGTLPYVFIFTYTHLDSPFYHFLTSTSDNGQSCPHGPSPIVARYSDTLFCSMMQPKYLVKAHEAAAQHSA